MMRLLIVLSVLLLQGKERVPAPDAQKEAEKLIREVFKDELAKKAPADRAALARKLLDQALKTDDDPASRFVLLREARDMARETGDWTTSLRAIDETGRRFDAETSTPKLAVYQAMAKAAKTPEEFGSLARRELDLADEAAKADQFEVAQKAVTEAALLARKAKEIPLASKADAKAKEINDRKTWHDRVARARETLAKLPQDPDANLTVGREEGPLRGEWEKALVHLSRGSDPALKVAAAGDLANPDAPAAQVAAGDAWWDLSDPETGPARLNLRRRAGYWYEKASGSVSGLVRTKVVKRLVDIRTDRFPGQWVEAVDPTLFGLPGKPGDPITVADEKDGFRILIKKPFTTEYDGFMGRFRMAKAANGTGSVWFEAVDRGLYVSRRNRNASMMMVVEGPKLVVLPGVPMEDKDDYLVTVILSGGQYIGYVDGVEVARLQAKFPRISHLGFQAESGTVTFDQIMLRRKE